MWAGIGRMERWSIWGGRDDQVKVRGYRIELGEIERVMKEEAWVREAVVVVREEGEEGEEGEKKLVAYVVREEERREAGGGKGERGISGGELREYLRGRLPEALVPGVYVELAELPLTPNGKVDRKRLPAPEEQRQRAVEGGYTGPRTEVEEVLCGIWAEVLGLERVGIHDNFFDLGGHSLLATQVIARVRDVFQTELPLQRIFERPTVAGLVAALEREKGAAIIPAIARVPRTGEIPLSFSQQRLWFLEQLSPGNTAYHIPLAVRLEGDLDVTALEQSLNEVVRRHEVLRTQFPVSDGRPSQWIQPAAKFQVEAADLSGLDPAIQAEEVKRQLQAQLQEPFDLATGQPLRMRLIKLHETDHVLLIVMHHIVTDGWSMGLLVSELVTLYQAFSGKAPSPLEELPVQYPDYAVWQREWLKGETLERQLGYWKKQLEGAAVLQLPTDHPRSSFATMRGSSVTRLIPVELSRELNSRSRQWNLTPFMTLLGAFQLLMSRYTGEDDITVGTPVANRGISDITSLIGLFVNTLALRTDLTGLPTLEQYMHRTRTMVLEALSFQDIPFEKLVDELQPKRDPSHTPLFQVMFVLQNLPTKNIETGKLRLKEVEGEVQATKFDLTLTAAPTLQGEFFLGLEYRTDLFERPTMERMLSHYQVVLEQMLSAAPGALLSELSLLTGQEREQLLVEWNRTKQDYPASCMQELFEEQVRRTSRSGGGGVRRA